MQQTTDIQEKTWLNNRFEQLLKYSGLISLACVATGFILAFIAYIFHCGRAVHFNIPIDEVPFSRSIETLIFYTALAAILVAIGFFLYKGLKESSDRYQKLHFTIQFLLIIFLIAFLITLMFFLVIDIPNLVFTISFNPILGILQFLLFVIISALAFSLIFFCIIAFIAYIIYRINLPTATNAEIENSSNNNKQPVCWAEKIKSFFEIPHFQIVTTIGIAITLIMIFFFGVVSDSAVFSGHKIASNEKDQYLIVFSKPESYCVEDCIIANQTLNDTSLNTITVDKSSYKWIPKDSVSVEVLKNAYLIDSSTSQYNSDGTIHPLTWTFLFGFWIIII